MDRKLPDIESVCIGSSCCVVEVECVNMSFVLAVLPPGNREVIFCSDGKEMALLLGETEITEESTIFVRDGYIKTLALNPQVYIGIAGYEQAFREYLERLLPILPWSDCAANEPPTNFADSYAERTGKSLLEIGLSECVKRTRIILEEIDEGKRTLPIVGGRENGVCGLHYAIFKDGAYSMKSTQLAYGDAPGFKASARFARTDDIVHHLITLANLEARPVESIAIEV